MGPLDVSESELELVGEVTSSVAPLHRVGPGVSLGQGRFLVAHKGSSEALLVDAGTGVVQRFGREGDGPGELRLVRGVFGCDETVGLTDGVKLVRFALDGALIEDRRVVERGAENRALVVGVRSDCSRSVVSRQEQTIPPEATVPYRLTLTVELVGPDGSEAVATLPGRGAISPGQGRSGIAMPFGADGLVRSDGQRIYLASTEEASVHIIDMSGGADIQVKWGVDPAPVSSADRDAWERGYASVMSGQNPDLVPRLEDIPLPDSLPVIDDLLPIGGSEGFLARRYRGDPVYIRDSITSRPEVWDVFDGEFTWLGKLTLAERSRLVAASSTDILVVRVDEFDVEELAIYRWPAGHR